MSEHQKLPVRILLYRGEGPIAALIRWQTRGIYGHMSIQVGSWVYEANPGGVTKHLPTDRDRKAHIYELTVPLSDDQIIDLGLFLEKQVGKKYDYTMVARFITRRQATRSTSNKWFCSEYIFAALLKIKVALLERVEPWAVSPVIGSYSPLLRRLA